MANTAMNLSSLSRGIGEVQRRGHEKIEVKLEKEDYHNWIDGSGQLWRLPPPKIAFQPAKIRFENHQNDSVGVSSDFTPSYPIDLPKTFTTRKGALLLFSEDIALTDRKRSRQRRRRHVGRKGTNSRLSHSADVGIHTVDDLTKSILSYGSSNLQSVDDNANSIYMKFIHSKAQRYYERRVKPGFSAKRYLGSWTQYWDQALLKRVAGKGFIKQVYFNPSRKGLYTNKIDTDLSGIPLPYRIMRQWLMAPGSIDGYTFYRAHTSDTDFGLEAIEEQSPQPPRPEVPNPDVSLRHAGGAKRRGTKRLASGSIKISSAQDGTSVDYSELDSSTKESVLAELLVKSAVTHAIQKQKEYLENAAKDPLLTGDQASELSAAYLIEFNMMEAIESVLEHGSVDQAPKQANIELDPSILPPLEKVPAGMAAGVDPDSDSLGGGGPMLGALPAARRGGFRGTKMPPKRKAPESMTSATSKTDLDNFQEDEKDWSLRESSQQPRHTLVHQPPQHYPQPKHSQETPQLTRAPPLRSTALHVSHQPKRAPPPAPLVDSSDDEGAAVWPGARIREGRSLMKGSGESLSLGFGLRPQPPLPPAPLAPGMALSMPHLPPIQTTGGQQAQGNPPLDSVLPPDTKDLVGSSLDAAAERNQFHWHKEEIINGELDGVAADAEGRRQNITGSGLPSFAEPPKPGGKFKAKRPPDAFKNLGRVPYAQRAIDYNKGDFNPLGGFTVHRIKAPTPPPQPISELLVRESLPFSGPLPTSVPSLSEADQETIKDDSSARSKIESSQHEGESGDEDAKTKSSQHGDTSALQSSLSRDISIRGDSSREEASGAVEPAAQVMEVLADTAKKIAHAVLQNPNAGHDIVADIEKAAGLFSEEVPSIGPLRVQTADEETDGVYSRDPSKPASAASAAEYKEKIRSAIHSAISKSLGSDIEIPPDTDISEDLLEKLASGSVSVADLELVYDEERATSVFRSRVASSNKPVSAAMSHLTRTTPHTPTPTPRESPEPIVDQAALEAQMAAAEEAERVRKEEEEKVLAAQRQVQVEERLAKKKLEIEAKVAKEREEEAVRVEEEAVSGKRRRNHKKAEKSKENFVIRKTDSDKAPAGLGNAPLSPKSKAKGKPAEKKPPQKKESKAKKPSIKQGAKKKKLSAPKKESSPTPATAEPEVEPEPKEPTPPPQEEEDVPDERTPTPQEEEEEDMEFVIVRDEEEEEDKELPPEPLVKQFFSDSEESSDDETPVDSDDSVYSVSNKDAQAAKRAAAKEKRKRDMERRRKEREDRIKAEKEEAEREERVKQQMEDLRRQREDEARQKRLQAEEERDREEREENEKFQREQDRIAREKRKKEEHMRYLAKLRAKTEEEERRRKEEAERLALEEEERRIAEEAMLAEMEDAERAEYERRKKEEEERRRIEEEEQRIKREAEAARAMEEARRLAEEMARAQEALRLRLLFQRGLLTESQGLSRTQDITRAFVFSYYELLRELGLALPDFETFQKELIRPR